ncbi:MAG: YbhB/YbcL family Raf kinase inhibitor-like protein [Patescibacteria group bacterium]
MKIESPAFSHMGAIPSRYACDGEKLSPPLVISGVTPEVKSLVLIMEDPDVPKTVRPDGMWDHWIRFNLPPTLLEIKENTDPGGVPGITTSSHTGYVPPCPPDREHRYFFKLYSLDSLLNLAAGATKSEVLAAMQSHILQEAELIGLYEKK